VAQVVFRAEVIEQGELNLVPAAKLKEAIRRLKVTPEIGKPLARELAGCRSIRIEGSENRLVYRIHKAEADGEDTVEVLAIGRRRDDEVYDTAASRT
jgi:mRNA-degrading endonuclease RelE of RelBE toxin-antitoxin system